MALGWLLSAGAVGLGNTMPSDEENEVSGVTRLDRVVLSPPERCCGEPSTAESFELPVSSEDPTIRDSPAVDAEYAESRLEMEPTGDGSGIDVSDRCCADGIAEATIVCGLICCCCCVWGCLGC